MEFKIGKPELEKVLGYLVKRPFIEVHDILKVLTGLKRLDGEEGTVKMDIPGESEEKPAV